LTLPGPGSMKVETAGTSEEVAILARRMAMFAGGCDLHAAYSSLVTRCSRVRDVCGRLRSPKPHRPAVHRSCMNRDQRRR
jgi:hypothetical protein